MSLLSIAASRDDQAILVVPEGLGLKEVDAMLVFIMLALDWIILKLHPVYILYR